MNDEMDGKCGIILIIVGSVILLIGSILLQFMWAAFSNINRGDGKYTGTIVETQHHGIIFKTYGVQLKTNGFTPRFEDFCVTDSALFEKISNFSPDEPVTITYQKKLATPSWQCDGDDSSDIIVDISPSKHN